MPSPGKEDVEEPSKLALALKNKIKDELQASYIDAEVVVKEKDNEVSFIVKKMTQLNMEKKKSEEKDEMMAAMAKQLADLKAENEVSALFSSLPYHTCFLYLLSQALLDVCSLAYACAQELKAKAMDVSDAAASGEPKKGPGRPAKQQ